MKTHTAAFGLIGLAVAVFSAGSAHAGEKNQYHLGNPTPRHLMREISPDRPDITESPRTVDAGHAQVELSFFERSWDDAGRAGSLSIAPLNLRIGLTNDVEAQVVVVPWTWINPGDGPSDDGFGDMALRIKFNLWGNDAGESAAAVMPFIVLPSGSDGVSTDRVEGGVAFPVSISLSPRTNLGLMAELDIAYDEDIGRTIADLVHSSVFSRELWEDFGAYAEFAGAVRTDNLARGYRASVGAGRTWSVSSDLVFDAGVVVGLTRGVDDATVAAGMTLRY